MKCPYCRSDIEDDAHVCKVCKRDVYLFQSLTKRNEELENALKQHHGQYALQNRIRALEALLAEEQQKNDQRALRPAQLLQDLFKFVFLPLVLLMFAHAMITVIYDCNLIYLRIVSIVLPLPFGFYLFKARKRQLMHWFVVTLALAMLSVIGMSSITSWVDHTSVMPRNVVEWREFIEYAASISFSFLTGMLLGAMVFRRQHAGALAASEPALISTFAENISQQSFNPQDMQVTLKKIEEVGNSLVAAGATVMSIYTGLKAFL